MNYLTIVIFTLKIDIIHRYMVNISSSQNTSSLQYVLLGFGMKWEDRQFISYWFCYAVWYTTSILMYTYIYVYKRKCCCFWICWLCCYRWACILYRNIDNVIRCDVWYYYIGCGVINRMIYIQYFCHFDDVLILVIHTKYLPRKCVDYAVEHIHTHGNGNLWERWLIKWLVYDGFMYELWFIFFIGSYPFWQDI